MDRVEEASNGRITTKRFLSAELVSTAEQLEACAKGTIDLFYCPGTYYTSIVPEGDYDLMFFNYPSQESAALFLDLPEVKEIYRDAYSKAGVFNIGAYSHAPQVLQGNFPITKLEDLAGRKMRAAGGVSSQGMEALGASAVYIAVPELYRSTKRHG